MGTPLAARPSDSVWSAQTMDYGDAERQMRTIPMFRIRSLLRLLASPAVILFVGAASNLCAADAPAPTALPHYTYDVVNTFPHDPAAFTQGLVYLDGVLYETTGLTG